MSVNVNDSIADLKLLAIQYGCKIRFQNHRTNAGDFCIFIYDKSFRNSYAVGFDGNYDSKCCDFEKCVAQAKHWLEHRDKRFVKVNGAWKVKPSN